MNQRGTAGTEPPDDYLEAAIQRLLTECTEIAEQGITVTRRDHSVVLCGEVESAQRREEILRLVLEHFPEVPVTVDIGLIRTQAPTEVEELR
ncbi:hypothetical protein [Plantactinospora sp. KLBMP9567]|uniref:hypothetical protein n=1 Tax=Plantactinospora sp. KLBMP9567 TaxID=3085900 RepID=UPI00298201D7|nr:hypothetical protein [Plantactinospora sp. KLBMP9567]MDW5323523.1 hypothetical protein [Plantactinospora sp. KLBMP9567]